MYVFFLQKYKEETHDLRFKVYNNYGSEIITKYQGKYY